MKKLNLKEKENFLNWYSEKYFDFETRFLNKKEKKEEIKKQFAEIKNLKDLLEIYFDTYIFRKEMQILEHGFGAVTGNNWDKKIVMFRGVKVVINDKYHTISLFNGENGFS